MKTYQPKHSDIKRNWHLIDAKDKVLGRLATEVAKLLMGKHKANYATHMDMGDNVVVINASEVVLTGRKDSQKVYYSHSGFPGGLKEIKVSKMREDNPARMVELAVTGMLPKNRLRDKRLKRLKIYGGSEYKRYQEKFQKANQGKESQEN